MITPWTCIKIGTAACLKIVHVAAWMIATYIAVHPLPTNCAATDCHFVIPKAEFMLGGMFPPAAPARVSPPGALAVSPQKSGASVLPLPVNADSWSPASSGMALPSAMSNDLGLLSAGDFLAQAPAPPESSGAHPSGNAELPPDEEIAPETIITTTGSAPSGSGGAPDVPIPEPASSILLIAGLFALVAVRCYGKVITGRVQGAATGIGVLAAPGRHRFV